MQYQDEFNRERHKEGLNDVEPSLYKVVLVNDDYTPMEFVLNVLQKFFYMDRQKAAAVMFEAHQTGTALAGIFSRDVAEAKVSEVIDYATTYQHPLNCSMEAAQ